MVIFYPCFFIKTHLYQKQKVDFEITFIPSRSEPTGTGGYAEMSEISKYWQYWRLEGMS